MGLVDDFSKLLSVYLQKSEMRVISSRSFTSFSLYRRIERLTIFSLTHILTSEWNSSGRLATFFAAIFAKAVPKDPDPTTATLCFLLGRVDLGRADGTGEEGRVISEISRDKSLFLVG